MSEQAASISVESVTVRYSNGHTAIRDVSFTLHLRTGGRKRQRQIYPV